MKFHAFLLLTSFVLSACTSSTRGKINMIEQSKNNQISQVISEHLSKSLKRTVTIGRFTDETKRGNSFLVDSNGIRLAKQASDILSTRLTDSGKFLLLERLDIDALNKENKSTQEETSYAQAEYMILGSVSEYGRSTDSEVGIFSRNKIQKANVTVNVRLVDTKTSLTVYSEEATGEATSEASNNLGVGRRAAYDTSLDDKALSAAISKLVSNIIENLLDKPWQAYIVAVKNNQYFMTGGKEQGIKQGDVFQVLSKGEKVKNPQTNQVIELPGVQVGLIEVIGFVGKGSDAISITKLKSGNIIKSNLSDYVVREL